ncbi:hypothetical protein SEA_ARACELI_45 [Streptomyces phage Araceli]|nr:hypothetical protein SEA_JACKIEB_45 [Streptomyces phage JackieB]QFG07859.1 hypothetical protein SEA_ARACELI_45 [Streptomyces phage Araceli]
MSRKNRRARLVAAGYSETLLERLARDGSVKLAAAGGEPRPFRPAHPLAMVQHPERARSPQRVPLAKDTLVYTKSWVPDEAHPLGGYEGVLTLYRRVNLRKDVMPRWIKDRPLYEFTKEPRG